MRKFAISVFTKLFDNMLYRYVAFRYKKIALRANAMHGSNCKLLRKEREEVEGIWNRLRVPYSYEWFVFYKKYTGNFSPLYVPGEIFNGLIEGSLNPFIYSATIMHKGLLDRFIDKNDLPPVFINKIEGNIYSGDGVMITREQAEDILLNAVQFVLKISSGSGGGDGVRFISNKDKSLEEKMECIERILNTDNDVIVQDIIEQHEEFAQFNRSSVNTVRLVSLNLNSKISVLSSFLRMGKKNMQVDNLNAGGMLVGIKETGELASYAMDGYHNHFEYSPNGKKFEGTSLSFYGAIKQKAIELHSKIPIIKLIGWDFTVDIDGNIKVIEINLNSQQIEYQQIYNGPLFGDRTMEVIEYIQHHKLQRFFYA